MTTGHAKKKLVREVMALTGRSYQAALNVLDLALDKEEWAEQIVQKAKENIQARKTSASKP